MTTTTTTTTKTTTTTPAWTASELRRLAAMICKDGLGDWERAKHLSDLVLYAERGPLWPPIDHLLVRRCTVGKAVLLGTGRTGHAVQHSWQITKRFRPANWKEAYMPSGS
jgi:hypothetical protein